MDFLNMETLPRFQERLDLAASELTDLEEIFCKAINELAGRLHIINNLLPAEERINKATEQNYKIVDTIYKAQENIQELYDKASELSNSIQSITTYMDERYLDLSIRLNNLDDAAARKADLNVVLYRTGGIATKEDVATAIINSLIPYATKEEVEALNDSLINFATKEEVAEILNNLPSQEAIDTWNNKQEQLIAGENITIEGNVISSTGGGGTAEEIEWEKVLNKPTNVSDFNNDASYITTETVETMVKDGGLVAWEDLTNNPIQEGDIANWNKLVEEFANNKNVKTLTEATYNGWELEPGLYFITRDTVVYYKQSWGVDRTSGLLIVSYDYELKYILLGLNEYHYGIFQENIGTHNKVFLNTILTTSKGATTEYVNSEIERIEDLIPTNCITEESDPTVPEYIKQITEEQINKWDNTEGTPYIEINSTDYPQENPFDLETLKPGDWIHVPDYQTSGYVKNTYNGTTYRTCKVNSAGYSYSYLYLGTLNVMGSSRYVTFLSFKKDSPTNGGSTDPSGLPIELHRFYFSTSTSVSKDVESDFSYKRSMMSAKDSANINAVHNYYQLPTSTVTPTADNQFTNKKYVDDAISAAITDALGGEY